MAGKKVIYSVMTMSLTLVILGCTPMQNTKAEDTTTKIEVVGGIDLDNPKVIAKDGKLVTDGDSQQSTTTKAEQPTTKKKKVTVKYKVKKTKYYRYAKKKITVKNKPIKKGKVKFKIKKGTKIKVVGKVSNGWRKVKVKGKVGYIPNKNLSKKKIKTTTKKKKKPSNNNGFKTESKKDYEKEDRELEKELIKNGVMNKDGTMNTPKGNIS